MTSPFSTPAGVPRAGPHPTPVCSCCSNSCYPLALRIQRWQHSLQPCSVTQRRCGPAELTHATGTRSCWRAESRLLAPQTALQGAVAAQSLAKTLMGLRPVHLAAQSPRESPDAAAGQTCCYL